MKFKSSADHLDRVSYDSSSFLAPPSSSLSAPLSLLKFGRRQRGSFSCSFFLAPSSSLPLLLLLSLLLLLLSCYSSSTPSSSFTSSSAGSVGAGCLGSFPFAVSSVIRSAPLPPPASLPPPPSVHEAYRTPTKRFVFLLSGPQSCHD